MTEGEWLACTDPDPMVRLLWETGSKRKLRLYAVACCKRILHLVPDGRLRASVIAVEDFADSVISMEQVEVIESRCLAAPMPEGRCLNPETDAAWVMKYLPNCCGHDPAGLILDFFSFIHVAMAGSQATVNSDPWQRAYKAEQEVESDLLRDIFGTLPFRPLAIAASISSWNDGTVVKLAQAIYEDRAFDRLPILADALEESGCTNADIPNHCRQPGEHVRGCWVLDLILGKE